jgi:hypothetical protein
MLCVMEPSADTSQQSRPRGHLQDMWLLVVSHDCKLAALCMVCRRTDITRLLTVISCWPFPAQQKLGPWIKSSRSLWRRVFLESLVVFMMLKRFTSYIDPCRSLLGFQKPAIRLCSEPVRSSSQLYNLFFRIHFNIILPFKPVSRDLHILPVETRYWLKCNTLEAT